ncbi:MAG TPA: threonine/serine dehydratase, partial [Roseimicrobium sp.]|nr:threonine/serine dehydratase [Roseimicrobium sp.]
MKTTQTKTTSPVHRLHAGILAARQRLDGAIRRTPCEPAMSLGGRTGVRFFLKREDLQRTGSFKERGARNALALLSPEQRRQGVIAASAGNHALGLAWHGRLLGVPVTVVMPSTAPSVKVENCRRYGADVVLHGATFDEAQRHALQLAERSGRTFVPPFDDLAVIAGQGTVALEVVEQVPDVDAVLVPVGGGGLLAGVVGALRLSHPHVRIIGVEPANAAGFSAACSAGHPVRVVTRPTLADGLAVAEVGQHTFRLAQDVDYVVTVDECALREAISALSAECGVVAEG